MEQLLLKNGIILDGREKMQPVKKDILICDGIIQEIEDEITKSHDIKTSDLSSKYVLPGLINLHCHLPSSGKPISFSKGSLDLKTLLNIILKFRLGKAILKKMCYKYAKIELLSGVTTIRTVGGISNIDSSIKDDINNKKYVGPNILSSNCAIATINGHLAGLVAFPCENVQQAIDFVDSTIQQGNVDLIKIMITGGVLDGDVPGKPAEMKMPVEMIRAICQRAHSYNLPVAAHVESKEGVKAALENGVDTIEHGSYLDEYLIDLFKKNNSKQLKQTTYICRNLLFLDVYFLSFVCCKIVNWLFRL